MVRPTNRAERRRRDAIAKELQKPRYRQRIVALAEEDQEFRKHLRRNIERELDEGEDGC